MRNVQAEDDDVGCMELHLGLGEDTLAPLSKAERRFFELMVEDLVRFRMTHPLRPSIKNDLVKFGQRYPEILEFEGPWPSGAPVIREKERTMIGKGG